MRSLQLGTSPVGDCPRLCYKKHTSVPGSEQLQAHPHPLHTHTQSRLNNIKQVYLHAYLLVTIYMSSSHSHPTQTQFLNSTDTLIHVAGLEVDRNL